MGLFGQKRNWEAMPAADFAANLNALAKGDKKKYDEVIRQMREGKIKTPGFSAKDQKKIEKELRRTTEGERGLGALRDAFKKNGQGQQGYKDRPLTERVHPSEWKRQFGSGKAQPNPSEAARIKKSDPALYQKILDQEVKRRGL